jgi:hypothetical protein
LQSPFQSIQCSCMEESNAMMEEVELDFECIPSHLLNSFMTVLTEAPRSLIKLRKHTNAPVSCTMVFYSCISMAADKQR